MTAHPGPRQLVDPGRVIALRDLGLTEASDPAMERYVERVRAELGVPVALVSLVQIDQQVFPGASGLPSPWAERRASPLSHSFSQYIAGSGEPLVVADAREDPRMRDNPAVTAYGLVAYAGMPLSDDHGNVLGALCAIDGVPRTWSEDELRSLADLAQDCGNELRLRLSRLEVRRERDRRDRVESQLQAEINRSRRMLAIAESLNEARTVEGIAGRLSRQLGSIPGFAAVQLHLADALRHDPPTVSSTVLSAAFQRNVVGHGRSVCAPVVGSSGLLGVIEMTWQVPRTLDETERTTTAALASYVAQALERSQLIERRLGVAHQLQSAMLTTLPDVPDLRMAACYVPAGAEEWVGGDWYDAIRLPPTGDADVVVAVTVGDVIGHDIPAAAVMGQARAMLRQAAFDRPGAGPADVFTSFERACAALDIEATGSAVLAFLERSSITGEWTMTWTSAGHPPPLMACPDGEVQRLELDPEKQGILFGYRDVYDVARVDSRIELPRGCTVLFYSDGVIEVPGLHIDEQIDELADVLYENQTRGPQQVVDTVSMSFGIGHDDVVALAVQVPPA
jgi:serine phosphatase RsbU (regulator of sigma subunit)